MLITIFEIVENDWIENETLFDFLKVFKFLIWRLASLGVLSLEALSILAVSKPLVEINS